MGGYAQHRVFVDSNVFYSKALCDWLGLLYVTGETSPFIVHWTEDVLADTIHHLRKRHPDWDGRRTSQIRDRIAGTFEIGRVADYVVDVSYRGRDPHDAHVHAAALACSADILLTCNDKDFAWESDDASQPYEVMTPDEFFLLIDDSMPELVCRVAHEQARYWVARAGEADLPAQLRVAGAPAFAERVRRHLQSL